MHLSSWKGEISIKEASSRRADSRRADSVKEVFIFTVLVTCPQVGQVVTKI